MRFIYGNGAEYFKTLIESYVDRREYKTQTVYVFTHVSRWPQRRKRTIFYVFVSYEPLDASNLRVCDLFIDGKLEARLRPPKVKCLYIPFYMTSFFERRVHKAEDTLGYTARLKNHFCAFLYWQRHEQREALYHAISKYKQVDALGRSCGPEHKVYDRRTYSSQVTFYDLSVEKYIPYKFVICCENTRLRGYVTEKIVNARLANAIPIYLGAPDIADHIYPEAFIDASKPNYLDEIKRLDNDPKAYLAMLQAPFFKRLRIFRFKSPYIYFHGRVYWVESNKLRDDQGCILLDGVGQVEFIPPHYVSVESQRTLSLLDLMTQGGGESG